MIQVTIEVKQWEKEDKEDVVVNLNGRGQAPLLRGGRGPRLRGGGERPWTKTATTAKSVQ